MSYELQVGLQEAKYLASNRGYGDVLDWLETLPQAGFENLLHLGKFGWDDAPQAVHDQLKNALEAHPPRRAEVRNTLESMLSNLAEPGEARTVSVTNGVANDAGDNADDGSNDNA